MMPKMTQVATVRQMMSYRARRQPAKGTRVIIMMAVVKMLAVIMAAVTSSWPRGQECDSLRQ